MIFYEISVENIVDYHQLYVKMRTFMIIKTYDYF